MRDTRAARRVKRLFDMVAAAGILVLLSPVLLILAVAVKMSSPGPIMTRQERLGQGGCAFLLHKFRTLHRGGEQGSAVAVRGDARVTPLGRWLRRTRLDELPQLIDVLRGKMSLVGPRPEVPHLLADVPRDVRDTVLSVRPGVTGPAAIDFLCADEVLDGMAEPEMLYIRHIAPLKHQMEAEYVRTWRLRRDAAILAATVSALVTGGRRQACRERLTRYLADQADQAGQADQADQSLGRSNPPA